MEYGPREREKFEPDSGSGLFIVNEGNFTYGNATLSFYDPAAKHVENDVFGRANGIRLGDVAQSMTMHNGRLYIVVNNSGIIFVIDPETFRVTGTITGLQSPRYIHFLADDKAYVTDLYASRIAIVNPQTLALTGYVDTAPHRSTEQMARHGRYIFTNSWSLGSAVLVIDTERDEVVHTIEVGPQPTSIALDARGKLWVLVDGGLEGSPSGRSTPSLVRIDAATFTVERRFEFAPDDRPTRLCLDGDMLYFLNRGVWRMNVNDDRLPLRAFIEDRRTIYYGIAVDPATSEIYVADAIDYRQQGMVYRYSPDGELLDEFRVGIIPGGFCFR
jgi:YVTN family beta-propeller protein